MNSLSNLPLVTVALSQATIHKANLSWLDIDKLQQAFPQNVQVLNDDVTLQGPIMLVKSLNPLHRFFIQSIFALIVSSATIALFAYVVTHPVGEGLLNAYSTQKEKEKEKADIQKKMIAVFLTCFMAGVAIYTADRLTHAGVYFYNSRPFYA